MAWKKKWIYNLVFSVSVLRKNDDTCIFHDQAIVKYMFVALNHYQVIENSWTICMKFFTNDTQ